MRVLDLFSCVGCHAIGMERAGHKVVQFCEIDVFRQLVLMKHWYGIPVHDDIKTLAPPRADICIGGPPCQRTSVASAIHGYRDGETLWPYQLDAGLRARAEWFVVEQPPGNAPWEAEVARDLSNVGYHVGRLEFGANDIGAPYLRRRVFMVACSSLPRLEVAWQAIPSAIERAKRTADARGDWDPDSIPSFGMDAWRSEEPCARSARIRALGDSNPPGMAEVVGLMIAAAHLAPRSGPTHPLTPISPQEGHK